MPPTIIISSSPVENGFLSTIKSGFMSLAIVNALNGMAQVFYFLNEDSQPTIFCTHWIVLVFQDVWAGFGVIISTSSFKSRIQTSQCPVHPPPHTIQHTSLWDG